MCVSVSVPVSSLLTLVILCLSLPLSLHSAPARAPQPASPALHTPQGLFSRLRWNFHLPSSLPTPAEDASPQPDDVEFSLQPTPDSDEEEASDEPEEPEPSEDPAPRTYPCREGFTIRRRITDDNTTIFLCIKPSRKPARTRAAVCRGDKVLIANTCVKTKPKCRFLPRPDSCDTPLCQDWTLRHIGREKLCVRCQDASYELYYDSSQELFMCFKLIEQEAECPLSQVLDPLSMTCKSIL